MTKKKNAIATLKTAHEIIFSKSEDRVAYFGGRDINVMTFPSCTPVCSVHPIANPSHIDFSPDGLKLVAKSTSGRTKVLDSTTGEVLADFSNQQEGEGGAALFSKCGEFVVSLSWGGLLTVRDVMTSEIQFSATHKDKLGDLSSPEDRSFFVYSVSRLPAADNVPPPPETIIKRSWPFTDDYDELSGEWPFIYTMQVSPSGRFLGIIYGAPPETIDIYDFQLSEVIASYPVKFGGSGCTISWSPDEQIMAYCGKDKVVISTFPDNEILHEIPMKYPCYTGFSPSSEYVAFGSWSKSYIASVKDLAEFAAEQNKT